MIKAFKDRSINLDKPVRVYRCLHREGKTYSILQYGVVVGHCTELSLKDVRFIVHEGAQKKVRETKQKNVHAFIEGYLNPNKISLDNINDIMTIKYNPYVNKGFTELNNNTVVHDGKYLTIGINGVVLYK